MAILKPAAHGLWRQRGKKQVLDLTVGFPESQESRAML
jgi:hypothetical protein